MSDHENLEHSECNRECMQHPTIKAEHDLNVRRIDALENIVKDIPRMQARVHMLMYIIIGTMTILISVSCFSFMQLIDFKKMYFTDRQQHMTLHSTEALDQEKRYVELINKLGTRVNTLEAINLFSDRSSGKK